MDKVEVSDAVLNNALNGFLARVLQLRLALKFPIPEVGDIRPWLDEVVCNWTNAAKWQAFAKTIRWQFHCLSKGMQEAWERCEEARKILAIRLQERGLQTID